MRCHVSAGLLVLLLGACGPSGGGGTDGGVTGPCNSGESGCDGNVWYVCVDGRYEASQACASACDPELGCVACTPLTGMCNGDTSHYCVADGSGWVDAYCDPVQGVNCDFETGLCQGICAPQNLGTSYIGCEYFPTVTATEVANEFNFAVVVANTTGDPADVTVDGGALGAPITFQVPPSSATVQTLPWVPLLKACTSGTPGWECGPTLQPAAVVAKGAYHLRSTRPVTVYQFNPLEYSLPEGYYSYVNDASLLLPANALTGNYVVAGYQAWDTMRDGDRIWDTNSPGALAITATRDGTTVQLATTTPTGAGNGAPAFTPGSFGTVLLNQGDVLEVLAYQGDLTGSVVRADLPVQVISAHYCTEIPYVTPACDHLEESMFPYETLAAKYIVTAPAMPSLPAGKTNIVRIVATEPGTSLTFDPPQSAPGGIDNSGEFIELSVSGDFQVTADKKILVAQYMTGQDAGGGMGDPAMTLSVATDQYRTDYLFHAPLNYTSNYVNVVAATGASIVLDDVPVSGFTQIGGSGMAVARQLLTSTADGNHRITGDSPFGISVYGYGSYTSYWYPGGLDLQLIVVE